MTKRYSSLSPLGNLSALRPGVSFVTNPRILTIAGFSAVAGVSAEIFSSVISNSLFKRLGLSSFITFNGWFPPPLTTAEAIFPESSVYLISILTSSFAYTYTSFLPSTE